MAIEQIKPNGKDDHQNPKVVAQREKPTLEKRPDLIG